MGICNNLKGFCLGRPGSAAVFTILGIVLVVVSMWFVLAFRGLLAEWLTHQVLVNGMLLGFAAFADLMLIVSFLCLGLSGCVGADPNCRHAYSDCG